MQWDRTKWERETGEAFPNSMQEAAALAEKLGYMLAIDFINAGFAMDAALVVISKQIAWRAQWERDNPGF